MKPVDQTAFTPTDGNCFTASLASLLEISLEDVPDLSGPVWDSWRKAIRTINNWLSYQNLCYVEIDIDRRGRILPPKMPPVYCLLSGQSPRLKGCDHTVVGRGDGDNFEIVHDPHPSRAGLGGPVTCVGFIVPLDPASNRGPA